MAVRYDFDTPEPPKLRAGIGAGRIVIETAETAETVVEVEAIRGDLENLKVEQHGHDIIIETRRRFALNRNDEYEIHMVLCIKLIPKTESLIAGSWTAEDQGPWHGDG